NPIQIPNKYQNSLPSKYRFTAWIFSFEENLAIKNAPPIVRLCLTIGVHFKSLERPFLFALKQKMHVNLL
ncbi:hypothetical protein P9H00_02230, partial [Bacillus cereus]|nr:hypothetical protein [Bacillus cereus]